MKGSKEEAMELDCPYKVARDLARARRRAQRDCPSTPPLPTGFIRAVYDWALGGVEEARGVEGL
jgi:hypothetical protein